MEKSRYYRIDQFKKDINPRGYAEVDKRSFADSTNKENREDCKDLGIRLEIPRRYIFGIQRKEEYSHKKEKLAKQEYRTKGKGFLYEYPVLLCALPGRNLIQLALIDGHHRTRYASQFGIAEIPSIILTPEQGSELLNETSNNYDETFTPESFKEWMEYGVNDALDSFGDLPDHKQPNFVEDIESLEDLARRFKSF